MTKTRLAGIALLLALLWFCMMILVTGISTPGYSHKFQAISELAAPGTPFGGLVRFGGFVPLGLVFIFFSATVWQNSNAKSAHKLVLVLLTLTGLAIMAAGIFPTDVHGRRNSFSGMAHAVAGFILLVSVSVTPLVAALAIGRRRQCPGFRVFSIACSFALLLLFTLLPNGISPAWIQLQKIILGDWFTVWYRYQGLDQRALFLVYFLWLFVFISVGLAGDHRFRAQHN